MSPLTIFAPLYFVGIMLKSKSKKAGAIYDLVWSAGILIWAIGVMGEGDSIALFGQIELPPTVFLLIIVGVMVSEAIALIRAFREKPAPIPELPPQDQAAMEAGEAQVEATRMEKPCTLYIVHTHGLIGSAAKMQLSLNGRAVGTLANSSYLALSTDAKENRLLASCPTLLRSAEIEFQAQSGGEVRIDLELWARKGIQMSVADSVNYRRRQPGQKRIRPITIGYVLWSLTNMWVYFLGIVPLVMTLRAAKTPFNDVAERKLRSAKKWNLWMSGLLATAVAAAVAFGVAIR